MLLVALNQILFVLKFQHWHSQDAGNQFYTFSTQLKLVLLALNFKL